MRKRRLATHLALALLLLSAAPSPRRAPGPQDGVDPAKQLEKFERYLERKPYHDWAFEQLMDAAVKANAVPTLVASYEVRAREGGSTAERVVYARLLARVDRVDEALEILRAITDPPAALWQLIGALELRRGSPAAAVEALDRAVASTTDRQELEALHRVRGEAYLAAGDSARAIEAFRALAALDAEDFQLRLEAAGTLARHGLTEAALEEFERAKALAGDDAARKCRVLSETGRLHEQLAQGDAALAVYDEALGLMGRGNWLKRDLYDRIVALHRRTKTLPKLAEAAAARAAASPGDLDALEFHARALREAGDAAGAATVLAAAVQSFPGDVPLARTRIELLRSTGDAAGVVAEYQRILAERPEELDLYLELGQAFAASGQLEQAKLQWQKTLSERLADPGLAARLAALYGLYGQVDDAVAMYEKAIALESAEIARYSDLAAYLKAVGREADVPAALERAEAAAGDDAGKLDDVALLWREFDAPERAQRTLERALALAPDDVKLLRRLADAQLEAGDLDTGTATLRRVIELAPDSGSRRSAVDRILQGWWRAGREDELLAAVAPGEGAVDRSIHARLLVRRRDPAAALAAYEALVATAPELEEAREALAKLYEEAGELELALAQYDALSKLRPQNRRKYLKDVAAIHLERYDQEAAFQCYDEILSSSPDNAGAFREVAKAYEQLGLLDKAIECHLQAIRLDPTDGRTRLDLAGLFRTTGEWDRGEREIVAAFDAKDETTRKRARETYHAMLAQEGRVDGEIAALRERIARNPYDAEAPVTLADLYIRELEFELAVDMLDELLAYQPSEPRLLRERARALVELERHAEAVEAYETLWKMPGADQKALALDIADAHIQRGDRARAEEILTQIGDPDALARAYERNDLFELAIETLERSLLRRPNDQRLLDRLARLQEDVRDHDAAIASVERLAELTGESWRVLTRLGTLYHSAGRRDEALAIGRRLFALVRVEDVPEPPREEAERRSGVRKTPPALARSVGYGRGGAYDQRLDELQSWYSTIEAPSEFADVAAEELRRQPSNDKLLSLLVRRWGSEDGKAAQLADVLTFVRARTLDVGKPPAGVTQDTWAWTLDGYVGRLATKDAVWGRARRATLEAEVAAAPDAAKARELADLVLDLGDSEGATSALRAGVAAHPGDLWLRTGLASQLQKERRFADAAAAWREVLAQLGASGATNAVPAEELELSFRSGRTSLLRSFPIHMQRRLTEADLRKQFTLTQAPRLSSTWTLGSLPPTPGGVQLVLARCLKEAGDLEGARSELAALAATLGIRPEVDADPTTAPISAMATLANTYASLDFDAEAKALNERLGAIEAALAAHPVHGFNRGWEWTVRGGRTELAKVLEREQRFLEAYDVRRELGSTDEAKLLLEERAMHTEAVAFYTERAAAAGDDLERWRDEMVKLAEIHQHARSFDACLATYQAIAERDPEDFAARDAVAKLHERAQRWEEALGAHAAIVEAKRAANRRVSRPTTPTAPRLEPLDVPRAEGDDSWAWDNLRNAARYSGSQAAGKHSTIEHYAAMLKLLLDQRQVDRATELMLQIVREDARNMSWLGYSLGEILADYRLEAAGVPILRLLHSYDDTNESLSMNYGNALMDAKRFDEARRVFRVMLDRASTQDYYRQEAQRQLVVAEKRLGIESTENLEELEAKVAADPKNAKARIALAQRLLADKQDAAALEHALAAEEVAPHLDEVRALVQRLLQLEGRHEELERRLVEKLDDLTDEDELVTAASQIADWRADRGDMASVDELFAKIRRKCGGRFRYSSPSDWYAKRGDLERAITELELDLEKADTWYKDQLRTKLANLRAQLGDPIAVLDAAWQQFEKLSARGDRGAVVQSLSTPLRRFQFDDAALASVEASAKARGGLRGGLELVALAAVRGDARGAEAQLHALAAADREHAFLYPALVDLARNRKDLPQALAYLAELDGLGVVSESSTVSTSIGTLAEADALRAELGALRFELEGRESAEAVWSEMYTPDEDQGFQVLAKLYVEHKLWPEALAAQRTYIEKAGARSEASQRSLADLLYEAGEVDESLATFERLLAVAEGDDFQRNEVQSRVMRLYRESGRLDARREQLRARLEKDPDDVLATLELARLEAETGDTTRALALLARVAERPDQLEQTAPVLIRAARAAGDLDEAGRWYEKLLAGNSEEWTRRSYATEYGKILVERGQLERAIEVVLGCFPDPEGEEALTAVFALLTEQRQHERALEVLARLVAVSARPENHLRSRVDLLRALERPDEAMAAIGAALVDPKQRKDWMFQYYRSEDQDGTELLRVTEALEAAPDDTGLMLRWVALASGRQEHAERSVALLERLVAAEPRATELQRLEAQALVAAKRYEEALPRLEAVLERLDRDRARTDDDAAWQRRSDIQSLRSERSFVLRKLHGDEAALAAHLDGVGLRYAASDRWNSDNTPLSTKRLQAMVQLGLDELLVREYGALPASQRSTVGYDVDLRIRALRYRSGEQDAVKEELFRRAFLASKDPFPTSSRQEYDQGYYDEFGNFYSYSGQQSASGLAVELIALAHEEGTLVAMRERVASLRAERGEDAALDAALREIDRRIASDNGEDTRKAQRAEQRAKDLESSRKQVEEDPYDPGRLVRLARQLLSANEAAEAKELLVRAEPLVRGRAFSAIQEYIVRRYDYGAPGKGVRFRFASSSSSSSGTGYSSWGNSGESLATEHLRLLAAAHLALGERDRGLELEERLARLGTTSNDGWTYDPATQTWSRGSQLIPLYASLGLDAEVERVAGQQLERIALECEGDPERARGRRDELANQVLMALGLRDEPPVDPAFRTRWIAMRQESFLAEIAANPEHAWRDEQYLQWLRQTAKDEAGARAHAAVVVSRPDFATGEPTESEGWLLLEAGEVERARERFQAVIAARTSPPSAATLDSAEIGLACCVDAADPAAVERVAPILRRAHASGAAEHPAIRHLLGLPPAP